MLAKDNEYDLIRGQFWIRKAYENGFILQI